MIAYDWRSWLQVLGALTELNLFGNSLGDEGATALAHEVAKGACLELNGHPGGGPIQITATGGDNDKRAMNTGGLPGRSEHNWRGGSAKAAA